MSHKKGNKDWGKVKEAFEEDNLQKDSETHPATDESLLDESVSDSLEHPNYQALERKLTEFEQEAFKYKEAAQRAMAELENVRERARKDVRDAGLYGTKNCLIEFLSVKDNLELSAELARKEQGIDGLVQGIELTLKLCSDVLEKHGVVVIDPQDQAFDPNKHEAVSLVEVEGVAPNTVITVFQKGYMLYERIIRPARVVVSK